MLSKRGTADLLRLCIPGTLGLMKEKEKIVVRLTKLGGNQEHGNPADISKAQSCSWSRSGDMDVLVKSCRAEMHSRHRSAVPLIV